jgi:hypothetical protein
MVQLKYKKKNEKLLISIKCFARIFNHKKDNKYFSSINNSYIHSDIELETMQLINEYQ